MILLCCSVLAAVTLAAEKPRVVLMATGGTIAGTHQDRTATTGYKPAALNAEAIVGAVPEVRRFADIECRQPLQIASENITAADWLKLAREVSAALANPKVSGVVITHGTDTMEETAWILDLLVKSEKPIILVGAMRPSTAISADGALNLYNAVAAASSPALKGLGAMIVMNDTIYAARDVRKSSTVKTNAFRSDEFGPLGYVLNGKVDLYYRPVRRHAAASEFNLADIRMLPRVEILYQYGGSDAGALDRLVKDGVKGVVIDCTGNGSLNLPMRASVKRAIAAGVEIVRTSRTLSGPVTRNGEVNDDEYGTIPGGTLSAQKARILLMLGLAEKMNHKELTRIFTEY